MAIKNLTDNASIIPAYPMIGKLRKGDEKDITKNKPGKELDHWRFTSQNPEIEKAFEAAYGKAPKSLTVQIPYASPDQAFPTWCEIWGATGLVHRCDGDTMQIWLEGDHYERGSKPCSGGHSKGDPMNDAVGRLELVLPELVKAGHVGVVIMETHSRHDLMSITKVLHQVYRDRNSAAGLLGVPFTLSRFAREITVPGYGKQAGQRSRATKYLVSLTPSSDWVSKQFEHAAIAAADPNPQLPSGVQARLEAGVPEIIDGELEPDMEPLTASWLMGEYAIADQAPTEVLAEMLWPDQWEAVLTALEGTKTYNTEEKVQAYLVEKYKDLAQEYADDVDDPGKLITHMEKAWPGVSDLYYETVAAFGRRPFPINMIKAFSDLAGVMATDSTLVGNREALGSVLLDKLCEAEGDEF